MSSSPSPVRSGERVCMNTETVKREKARNMRYKKSALSTLGIETIKDELYEIGSECSNIQWFVDDDETLLNALDGDEEEEYEFRMMFSDLSAKCDQLDYAIRENYVTEHFDDLLVGILGDRYRVVGYDGYEEDYFNLTSWEGGLAQKESGKRLMRLTKEDLLSVAGQCLGVVISFLDIRHTYDYLKSTFDILKNENTSVLKMVKDIEEAYEKANEADFYGENARSLDILIQSLPERFWLE